MDPGAAAAISGLAAGLGSGLGARALGASGRQAALIGAGVGVATAAIVYVIAKRKATERQRQIAEQRAAAYQQRVASGRTEKPKTRYVALKTVPTSESKGAADVMLFDTRTNQVVGNSVYELKQTPSSGEVVKFDTHSAEYVSAY